MTEELPKVTIIATANAWLVDLSSAFQALEITPDIYDAHEKQLPKLDDYDVIIVDMVHNDPVLTLDFLRTIRLAAPHCKWIIAVVGNGPMGSLDWQYARECTLHGAHTFIYRTGPKDLVLELKKVLDARQYFLNIAQDCR